MGLSWSFINILCFVSWSALQMLLFFLCSSRLNFPSFATHLLILPLFYSTGESSRVARFVCFSSFSFCSVSFFRVFRHILHMRCGTYINVLLWKALFGFWFVWLSNKSSHLLMLFELYSTCADFQRLLSTSFLLSFTPQILVRFIIKHYSLKVFRFRTTVTLALNGCR